MAAVPDYTLPEAAQISVANLTGDLKLLAGKVDVSQAATVDGQRVTVEVNYTTVNKNLVRNVIVRDMTGTVLSTPVASLLYPKIGREVALPKIRVIVGTSYQFINQLLDPAVNLIQCYTPGALIYNDDGGVTGFPINAGSYFKFDNRPEIDAARFRSLSGSIEIIISPYITL